MMMVLDHIADCGDLKTRILKFMLQARYSICDKILYRKRKSRPEKEAHIKPRQCQRLAVCASRTSDALN